MRKKKFIIDKPGLIVKNDYEEDDKYEWVWLNEGM